MAKSRLALLWHMHQPLYREAGTATYIMPWVRLHATRAYYDMAWMLERHERVRCTVNFTPVLLEQIEDYVQGRARDRLVDLSARAPADLSESERVQLLRGFFMVDWEQCIRPVARYWDLLEKRGKDLSRVDLRRTAGRFTDGELQDLQVLFNLSWMGFGALADDGGLAELARKGRDFSRGDVDYVLGAQRRILAEIVPRWRRLAERGQVELSTTPYYHPILPLVLDSDSAARALPGSPLPPRYAWPDDARWQVREALASHGRRFGRAPGGVWPAEGAVSPEALEVLAGEGVGWAASDEGVLLRSLPSGSSRVASLFRPWRVSGGGGREVPMLFRDRGISDLVGFTYSRTPAADAVADFVGRVAGIGDAWQRERQEGPATVGVFLDGENPWERFPRSGLDFLDGLYRALEEDARIETVTMSEATAAAPDPVIDRIHSGSWIESSYRIWIGHREDRLAWTSLARARASVEAAAEAGAALEVVRAAKESLYVAEGSDWYWWYGEDFATENAAEFDRLFRGHVVRACELVGAGPPYEATVPIKQLGGTWALEAKPLREPTQLIHPVLDGRLPTYFEWQGAGHYRPGQHVGSMFADAQAFRDLYYGFDESCLYLRLDPAETAARAAEVASRVRVVFVGPRGQSQVEFDVSADGAVRPGRRDGAEFGRAVLGDVLEVEVPFAALGQAPGEALAIAVDVGRGALEIERLPRTGYLSIAVPGPDFERIHWRV
ncbi:MAG TPA: glycoside hydrolase family 57 protein [Anaeromyxobacteraceae bacterium]|nr:glycoside hydrolase family 57 protein [Anaeromyxobacteraceae bacterium]